MFNYCLFAGIILYIWDSHFKGGVLNMSGTVRAKLQSITRDEADAEEPPNDSIEIQNRQVIPANPDTLSSTPYASTSWNRNTTDSKLE